MLILLIIAWTRSEIFNASNFILYYLCSFILIYTKILSQGLAFDNNFIIEKIKKPARATLVQYILNLAVRLSLYKYTYISYN